MRIALLGMRLAVWAGLCGMASIAAAHDTWFSLQPPEQPTALWLGTGDRFPVMESRVEMSSLQRHGCAPHGDLASRGMAAGRPLAPMSGPVGRLPQALSLRLPPQATGLAKTRAETPNTPPSATPHSCWASLVPFDLELDAKKVETYLQEIAAGSALKAAWAAEQAAGRPWRERFVKHARMDLGGSWPQALGLTLEALPLSATLPKAGQSAKFRLLHQGQPLADQPVEFVSTLSRIGIWKRTDAQGQVETILPLKGPWLLRATLLRPPAQPGERWLSDFVTLVFDVAP